MKIGLFCFFVALVLFGCDEVTQRQKMQARAEQPSPAPSEAADSSKAKRFVFPAETTPFAASSVALDTITGLLCKTYAWQDTARLPRGLPLCSELTTPSIASLVGAAKAYKGFTYTFNGEKWVKGNKAQKYNPQTQGMEPWSEDQYDPLNLFSKEEKAKRLLTVGQIRKVANQFGVSIEEAWEDAKAQGYQVPPPLSSFEKR
jgi:hypothetical protein